MCSQRFDIHLYLFYLLSIEFLSRSDSHIVFRTRFGELEQGKPVSVPLIFDASMDKMKRVEPRWNGVRYKGGKKGAHKRTQEGN